MEYHLRIKLNGNIAMTSCFHENSFLQRDRSLYKFIWVRHGTLDVEVDHVVMHLEKEEMISLTPLHHVQIRGVCLLYTSPSPRDLSTSRMPSSA